MYNFVLEGPEDLDRLANVQREQQRDDENASKAISRPCCNVRDDDESSEDRIPSKDEVEYGDETVSLKE